MSEFLDAISKEELMSISNAKLKTVLAVSEAQKAASNARIAELEYSNLLQQIYIKYGMRLTDSIDEKNGTIKRSPVETPAEPFVPVESQEG